MPNHVINKICMQGDPKEIQSMLEQIKNDDFGIGTVDFDILGFSLFGVTVCGRLLVKPKIIVCLKN